MRTVRIGMLTPTPSVSVPQITGSRPSPARRSTIRRYFGSMPAWCTPTPLRSSRSSVSPKPRVNRTPRSASAIASRCVRVVTVRLTSDCARSIAAACVACTTYTGLSPSFTASSTLSDTEVMRHWWYSGVGRCTDVTSVTLRPDRCSRSEVIADMSPRVADASRNWHPVSSSSGTCQAHPRSRSA